MCTLVILRRPEADWPLILGANRDEMRDRPWRAPGRHWPDRADVVAGLDEVAGGSWLGLNDHGVLAAVLNRVGTLGPAEDKRSRGELVLEALDHADAVDAAAALSALDPDSYRPFNLLVADARDAYWLCHRGKGPVQATAVPEGLSMLTARELNDPASPRIARYRARFQAAEPPDPDQESWGEWQALLGDTVPGEGFGPESAMSFMLPNGFGTLSSSLLMLPAAALSRPPVWRFARADEAVGPWTTVGLD